MSDVNEPGHSDNGVAHGLEIPAPIARRLIASFILVLGLVVITASLAIYNKDSLSDEIDRYASEEAARHALTSALLEIEVAGRILNAWSLSPEMLFNDAAYALHIQTATEMLSNTTAWPPELVPTRDAVSAALKDLEDRRQSARAAAAEGRLEAGVRIAAGHAAIEAAVEAVGRELRERRAETEHLRQNVRRASTIFERSLAVIIVAMTLAAIFLAFIWKRLIDLH